MDSTNDHSSRNPSSHHEPTVLPLYSDLSSLRSFIQGAVDQREEDDALDVRLFFNLIRHVLLCVVISVVILLVHIVVFIVLALVFADKTEEGSKQGFWSYSTFFVFAIVLLLLLYSMYRTIRIFTVRIIRCFSEQSNSAINNQQGLSGVIKHQLRQTVQEFIQTFQSILGVSSQQEPSVSPTEFRTFLVEALGLGLLNPTRQRRQRGESDQHTEEDIEETSNLLLGSTTEGNPTSEHLRRHLRLSLMGREFNENDYETLLALDEHDQEMRDFIQGCSISDLQSLP